MWVGTHNIHYDTEKGGTMYFDSPGPENTGETLRLAVQEAIKRQISHIVAASNTWATIFALAEEAQKQGYAGKLVCVSHVYGFEESGKNELSDESRAVLEKQGIRVCTAAHALTGAERGLSRRFQGVYPLEIIAHSLRMFSQGMKVCVEIATMAMDSGLIPFGKPVIALGGSVTGADTAAVITPGYSSSILSTKIHEILCKPK